MITAMITPFLCDGSVDFEGLKQNILFQIENGISGLLLLGTTGEAPTITHDERCEIIHTAAECINKRVPLMVGTGTNSTETTIQYTAEAYALGADSALIVTPYYNCPTQKGIIEHFKAVIDETTKIPLYYYNHPKRTGTALELATLLELAKKPRIKGIKDCSGDMAFFKAAREKLSGSFEMYSGDDTLFFNAMDCGANGLISVVSNLIPHEMATLFHRWHKEPSAAKKHFETLLPLIESLFIESNPIPIKAAMEHFGLRAGRCRLPLSEMEAEKKAALLESISHFESPILQQQP